MYIHTYIYICIYLYINIQVLKSLDMTLGTIDKRPASPQKPPPGVETVTPNSMEIDVFLKSLWNFWNCFVDFKFQILKNPRIDIFVLHDKLGVGLHLIAPNFLSTLWDRKRSEETADLRTVGLQTWANWEMLSVRDVVTYVGEVLGDTNFNSTSTSIQRTFNISSFWSGKTIFQQAPTELINYWILRLRLCTLDSTSHWAICNVTAPGSAAPVPRGALQRRQGSGFLPRTTVGKVLRYS